MTTVISNLVECQAGLGNCIGIPPFYQAGGTVRRSARLSVASAVSGPDPIGRLAIGNPRGPWRISQNLRVPAGSSLDYPLADTDEVASFVLQAGPQRPVSLLVDLVIDSHLTIGAMQIPIRHGDFIPIPFQPAHWPSCFVCCDFGPLHGLELVFTGRNGETVDYAAGPWPTGRTNVPVRHPATGLSVAYKSPQEKLAPPASIILTWAIAEL